MNKGGHDSDTEKKTDARQQASDGEVSETWAHETIQELLDFWEEQGVYIRE